MEGGRACRERWHVQVILCPEVQGTRRQDTVGLLARVAHGPCEANAAQQPTSVASVAFAFGYEAEKTFAAAFKRVTSQPPSTYRGVGPHAEPDSTPTARSAPVDRAVLRASTIDVGRPAPRQHAHEMAPPSQLLDKSAQKNGSPRVVRRHLARYLASAGPSGFFETCQASNACTLITVALLRSPADLPVQERPF